MASFFDDFNGTDNDYESYGDEMLSSVSNIEGYAKALPGLAEEKTLQQVLSVMTRTLTLQQDVVDTMITQYAEQRDDMHIDSLDEESRHDALLAFFEKWFQRNADQESRYQQQNRDLMEESYETTHSLLDTLNSSFRDLALADYLRKGTSSAENIISQTYDSMIEMRKAFGWTQEQYNYINEAGLGVVRYLNDQYDNKFNTQDMYQAYLTMGNAGMRDQDQMIELLDTVMMMNKTMPGASEANLEWMARYSSRYGADAVSDIISSADALVHQYGVNAEEVFKNLNSGELADLILKNASSAEEATSSAESLMGTVAMISSQTNMDPEKITGLMEDIMESRYTDSDRPELERMLAGIGYSGGVEAAQSVLNQGDFMGFAEQIISGINTRLENGGEVALENLTQLGWDKDILLGTEVYYDQIMSNFDNVITTLETSRDEIEGIMEDYPVGLIDRFFNGLSTNPWFNDVVELLGSLDLSVADIYLLVAAIKTGWQLIKTVGSGVGKLLGLGGSAASSAGTAAVAGAAAKVPFMMYDAAHGGIWQTTSTGLMGKVVGSTGNAMISGSGLLGLASKAGYGLQSAGLAGQATSTGLGAAASGAASVAGGVLAGASIIDGVVDIVNSESQATWQAQNDKIAEGAIQIGAVASGAGLGAAIGSVVPGIGTLIGAGVGGLVGLIFGGDAAEVITDYLDGTKEIESALTNLEESADELNETWENRKSVEDLIDTYYDLESILSDNNLSAEDRNTYENQLYEILSKLNELYPGMITANWDNEEAVREGIKAIDDMTEAELILAQTRAKNSIRQGVDVEEDLAEQLSKSKQTSDSAMKDIRAYNTLAEQVEELEKLVNSGELVFSGNYGGMGIDESKSSDAAIKKWEDFYNNAYDLWSDTGLNVAWGDNVSVGWNDAKNAISVYENMTGSYAANKMEDKISNAQEAALDVQTKQENYDKAFEEIVNNVEAGMGMTVKEAKTKFYQLDDDTRDYLDSTVGIIDLSKWDQLSDKDLIQDKADMTAINSYLSAWNKSHSHYYGLESVPFDDYYARLHSGEMILPAEASTALRTVMGAVGITTMPQLTTVLTSLSDALVARQRDEELGTDKAGADYQLRAKDYAEQVLKAQDMSASYLDAWSPNTPVIDDFMKYFDSIYDQIAYDVSQEIVDNAKSNNLGGGATITSTGRQAIVDAAKGAVGKEYIWGGEMYDVGMRGADCSGLVYYAYNEAGYGSDIGGRLTASGYYARGTNIEKDQLQPGDVVYTNFENGKPGHIGIYIGPNHVIDAGNKKAGIRDTTLSWWTQYQQLLPDSVLGTGQVESDTQARTRTETTSTSDADGSIIWSLLYPHIGNPYGVAGAMGNLYAESGLKSTNLQNSYERSLGYNDESYTQAVDAGTYGNFVHDSAGYGLAQWTYWSRKQNMKNHLNQANQSIGSMSGQIDFLMEELGSGYSSVLNTLKNATSLREASDSFLLGFERPADQSENAKKKRANYGQVYYDKYMNGVYGQTSYIPDDVSVEKTATETKAATINVTVADPAVVNELRRTTMRLESKIDQITGYNRTPRVSTRASVNPNVYG